MAQKLNPWVALLLSIIPVANLILFYYWNKGIKAKWKLDIDPVLRTLGLLVPILNLILFYIFLEDVERKAGKVQTPPPWWAIMFIVPFANFVFYLLVAYYTQDALNNLNIETL